MARLSLYQRFVDRQGMVNTLVSDLLGPTSRLALGGLPITGMVPLAATSGNLTVSFSVLSYAGDLVLAAMVDPDGCPDLDRLMQHVGTQLDALTSDLDAAPGVTV